MLVRTIFVAILPNNTQAIDLSAAAALDIKFKWDDNSNDKSIINKMLVVTRSY
jgi:hypothetical protein